MNNNIYERFKIYAEIKIITLYMNLNVLKTYYNLCLQIPSTYVILSSIIWRKKVKLYSNSGDDTDINANNTSEDKRPNYFPESHHISMHEPSTTELVPLSIYPTDTELQYKTN